MAELRLQIRRSEGNTQECEIYRALGQFPRLRALILDLHFDPRERGPDPDTVRRMSPDQFGGDDEDEEEGQAVDPVLLRTTLINAATDEILALGIWDLIATSQPSGCLQNLRIVPFGLEMCSPDESYFLIFLARSFLVSRLGSTTLSSRRLGGCPGWSGKRIRMAPVGCACYRGGAEEVVAALWPALAGRDDWSSGWASFPLESGGH
ncbi:hypothetical protein ASPCAL07938 [Aspergillus calidoustus]|uniref:Uncharacterized protein n=1 Tax=Aspergillus calidoustus TaxID=454130 RepID=A0A0U5CPV5_ASPCI|nr:hypothetical protein ASPCAL07938 [Aspergillus calidoustus]